MGDQPYKSQGKLRPRNATWFCNDALLANLKAGIQDQVGLNTSYMMWKTLEVFDICECLSISSLKWFPFSIMDDESD